MLLWYMNNFLLLANVILLKKCNAIAQHKENNLTASECNCHFWSRGLDCERGKINDNYI